MRLLGHRPARGGGAGGLRRVLAVTGLLVVAAFGAVSREGAQLATAGILRSGATAAAIAFRVTVVTAAGVAVAVVAGMLAWRVTRPGRPVRLGWPRAGGWRWAMASAAALSVAAVIGVVLAGVSRARHPTRVVVVTEPGPGTGSIALIALASTAVVVSAVVFWWSHRRRMAVPADGVGEPESRFASAVAAGSEALERVADPRLAIVACYGAMEAALANAGAARRAADTPEELLLRAYRDGFLRTQAASGLTELFREARFSTHPLGQVERDAAAAALWQIRRDLRGWDGQQ